MLTDKNVRNVKAASCNFSLPSLPGRETCLLFMSLFNRVNQGALY